MKKCKHCGTENEDDFIRKSGSVGVTVCTKCYIEHMKGEKHHFFGKHHSINSCTLISKTKKGINIKSNKKCKYCNTENEDDFIRLSGRIGKTVCTNCFIQNLSKLNTGRIASLSTREKMSITCSDGRRKGENHPNYNKRLTPEHCANMSKSLKGKKQSLEDRLRKSTSHRYTLKDFKEKYPLLCLEEEMRELSEDNWEIGKSSVQFKCKKCNNWFTPTQRMVYHRNKSLEKGEDGSYLYCSEECKNSCSLFDLRTDYFLNNLNRTENKYKYFGSSTWRNEVLNRQLQSENICFNHCEKCNSEIKLEVHHEKPVKTHPHLVLDPDNGIILCKDCHSKFGHKDECSTGRLANKICE